MATIIPLTCVEEYWLAALYMILITLSIAATCYNRKISWCNLWYWFFGTTLETRFFHAKMDAIELPFPTGYSEILDQQNQVIEWLENNIKSWRYYIDFRGKITFLYISDAMWFKLMWSDNLVFTKPTVTSSGGSASMLTVIIR